MREVRDSLLNLEGLVKMNVRLKNELNVDSRSYWKNLNRNNCSNSWLNLVDYLREDEGMR